MTVSDRVFLRRREVLVNIIREQGIDHQRVLKAVGTVPREHFVSSAFRDSAYKNVSLPIGLKQTISQPYTVAYQTMLLDPQPGDRVLEIGTGSGYQAAILCEMGARVFSIERHHALYLRSREVLRKLGYNLLTRHGDGTIGWAACQPFDGIIVTAGAPTIPEELVKQLRIPMGSKRGGRLIIPVGARNSQIMNRMERTAPDTVTREEHRAFIFVPLLKGDA